MGNLNSYMEKLQIMILPHVAEKIREIAKQYNASLSAVICDILSDLCMGEFTTAEVAKELNVSPQVVRQNWKKWGLRVVGRGAHGRLRFSRASVLEFTYGRKSAESSN